MVRFNIAVLCVVASTLTVSADVRDYLEVPDEWFRTPEGRQRLDNVLSHQAENGSWPKNVDTAERPYEGPQDKIKGTFDNSATVHELRLLGRAFQVTDDARYRDAFRQGLECILDAQYNNGGWPQTPNGSGYSQHITFNDGTMVGLMNFLREVRDQEAYDFVSHQTRNRIDQAFNRGIQCILACQIKVDGLLTAWCAQHDRVTLEPRAARSYEHPSISGGESAGIACLLMSIEHPSEGIQESVRAAVAWYNRSKITGVRYDRSEGDGRLVSDPEAPALWARFYDIQTNRPIFSGRDGVIKYDVAEIEAERRRGYAWYTTAGKHVAKCWNEWPWK